MNRDDAITVAEDATKAYGWDMVRIAAGAVYDAMTAEPEWDLPPKDETPVWLREVIQRYLDLSLRDLSFEKVPVEGDSVVFKITSGR